MLTSFNSLHCIRRCVCVCVCLYVCYVRKWLCCCAKDCPVNVTHEWSFSVNPSWTVTQCHTSLFGARHLSVLSQGAGLAKPPPKSVKIWPIGASFLAPLSPLLLFLGLLGIRQWGSELWPTHLLSVTLLILGAVRFSISNGPKVDAWRAAFALGRVCWRQSKRVWFIRGRRSVAFYFQVD